MTGLMIALGKMIAFYVLGVIAILLLVGLLYCIQFGAEWVIDKIVGKVIGGFE